MSDSLQVISYLGSEIYRFGGILGDGLHGFIDFLLNLPTFFHSLIDFIPMPIQTIILSFIGFIIFMIILKVVSHFV